MFQQISTFLGEVRGELKKVSWSTREELVSATIVVFVATAFFAVYVGACDFILSRVITILIR